MNKRRPSMRDVADAASVSVSAVSLVVRGKPGVADETRERVWKTIAQLGYTVAVPEIGKALSVGLLIERSSMPVILDIFYGDVIRGFQMEELSLYTDGSGVNWLGQSTADLAGAWSAVTPLAGPLQANGLSFTYYDTLNVVTATKTNVASVGVVVRSQSVKNARRSTGAIGTILDSLITRVALRNNKRF